MASREAFLKGVREALGKGSGVVITPPEPDPEVLRQKVKALQERPSSRRGLLVAAFASKAQLMGWKVKRVKELEEAAQSVVEIVQARAGKLVVRSAHSILEKEPFEKALKEAGIAIQVIAAHGRDGGPSRDALRERMLEADAGLTGADYAIAETGSIVLLPRRGISRLVSLLPPVHIAVLEPHQVLETLDDLFLLREEEYLRTGSARGYMNIITGPSRTGDIEQTIVVGVHGPREAHLVLLEEG